ncbi:poly-gamma-glutamate biosynthesis protein PgsC [bacterium]|nr:poly-gamma-glutamate biosynthesis protein PgsC [bacterium]
MLFEYFFIGLVLGFVFYELTGVSPGGVIAPAYCALFVHEPSRIVVTVVIALAVWGIVKLMSRHLILYGRRRLMVCLILGFCIKVLIETQIQTIPSFQFDLQSVGYIIPGLIASEMERQRIIPTVAALGIVTVLTYLVILVIA